MRKHCHRVPRSVSVLISPEQHANLILPPRLHLLSLLDRSVDPEHQFSVLGLFDIAFSLAYLKKKHRVRILFQEAQEVMFRLIKEARSPTQAEGNFLLRCVDHADYHFGIQQQKIMIGAIVMAEKLKNEGARLAMGNSHLHNHAGGDYGTGEI